jgi:hypothetical protein
LSIFSGINNESWDDQQGDQIGLIFALFISC